MSREIPHPSKFVAEPLADQLREAAFDAEFSRSLHEKQVAAIYNHNWFNLYVPKGFRGLELSLPEILRLEEGIAWADGSSGWVVTLCSGAAWFIGFLDRPLAGEVFKSKGVCIAGSGATTGIAHRAKDGYEITGSWPYATGSLLATAFTVNCLIWENDAQVYGVDGKAMVKSFLLMPEEVDIFISWNAMGMVATGSHSIEVKSVQVPENRSFIIHPDHAVLPDPIFRYPFQQLAETTLTVNLSGMASRFLDLAEAKLKRKSNNLGTRKILESRDRLLKARVAFYQKTDEAWNSLTSGLGITHVLQIQISQSSQSLVNACRESVNLLYPYCGLEAADTRTEINRVWRNFQTAGQHSLFRDLLG